MIPHLYPSSRLSKQPIFSIEFFPPKTENAAQQLLATADELKPYRPDFASITYGAGGSTRSRTLKYAKCLHEDYGYRVMPHLTCVGHSRTELRNIIEEFKDSGLDQIMALRGDPPKGEANFEPHPDGLRYANELVELIREVHPECAIGVAGYPGKHPEAISPKVDLQNLKRKVDAGSDFITTQLFFENRIYFEFVDRCREAGITVPILPGLLCIVSTEQVRRFCALCETEIPAELEAQLDDAGEDKEKIETLGAKWILRQARELLEKGAPGIHLYILNRSGPAKMILQGLQGAGFYNSKDRGVLS
ncbi:MAG TPA: methylenetetrahydrofolate reductase [NAD(P)H] [Opitutales bacterium]|nr:methylenetetrahydrofolate reductase [NAD(P)H] [Opitutales bacterium]